MPARGMVNRAASSVQTRECQNRAAVEWEVGALLLPSRLGNGLPVERAVVRQRHQYRQAGRLALCEVAGNSGCRPAALRSAAAARYRYKVRLRGDGMR